MITIVINASGQIIPTPEELLPYFCTAATNEQAQEELWKWILPYLLGYARQNDMVHVDQIIQFYERLEYLVNIFYQGRQGKI